MRYDKNGFMQILPHIERSNVISFLKDHQSDLDAITSDDDVCELIDFILVQVNNDNKNHAAEVLSLFILQLSALKKYEAVFNFISKQGSYPYTQAIECAACMRSAISSGDELIKFTHAIEKELQAQGASDPQKVLHDFVTEQIAYWRLQVPLKQALLGTKYTSANLPELLRLAHYKQNQWNEFLELHRHDFALIDNESNLCEVLWIGLGFNIDSNDEITANKQRFSDLVALCKPALSAMRNTQQLVFLMNKFEYFPDRYPDAVEILARGSQAGIRTRKDLAAVAACFPSKKAAESFIREQDVYFEQHEIADSSGKDGLVAVLKSIPPENVFSYLSLHPELWRDITQPADVCDFIYEVLDIVNSEYLIHPEDAFINLYTKQSRQRSDESEKFNKQNAETLMELLRPQLSVFSDAGALATLLDKLHDSFKSWMCLDVVARAARSAVDTPEKMAAVVKHLPDAEKFIMEQDALNKPVKKASRMMCPSRLFSEPDNLLGDCSEVPPVVYVASQEDPALRIV